MIGGPASPRYAGTQSRRAALNGAPAVRHAVVVSPNPPDTPGGVERSAELVRGVLEQQGWRVSVVWPQGQPPRWAFRAALGPLWLSRAAARAAHATGAAQLIVTNGFLGAGFPADVPRVHVYHGTQIHNNLSIRASMPRRELVRRLVGFGLAERASARRAAVLCVSASTADEVRRLYGVKVHAVLPNPVDTNVFRPLPQACARQALGLPLGTRLALFVGREDPGKGADLALGAASRAGYDLAAAGPRAFCGARNLGVLDPHRLALAYSACDCVVAPSSYEACSFVALEALACGVPLISTRVGWMKDLLRAHPDYDALCVDKNEAEITDRLARLPVLATGHLIARVRQWVAENHSLVAYAGRWADILLAHTPARS